MHFFLVTGYDQISLQIIIFFFVLRWQNNSFKGDNSLFPHFECLALKILYYWDRRVNGMLRRAQEDRMKSKEPSLKRNMKLLSVVAGEIEGSLSLSSGHAHKEITKQKCCFKKQKNNGRDCHLFAESSICNPLELLSA